TGTVRARHPACSPRTRTTLERRATSEADPAPGTAHDRVAVGLAAPRLPRRGPARSGRPAPVRLAGSADWGRGLDPELSGAPGVHAAAGAPGRLRRDLRHPSALQPV